MSTYTPDSGKDFNLGCDLIRVKKSSQPYILPNKKQGVDLIGYITDMQFILPATIPMFHYRKYNIRTTDKFKADDYPKVVNELEDISQGIAGLPGLHKEDIIISWLKDRSATNTWQSTNPALTALFTSGHFVTTNLESLLECSRTNHQFNKDLEEYIRKNLS